MEEVRHERRRDPGDRGDGRRSRRALPGAGEVGGEGGRVFRNRARGLGEDIPAVEECHLTGNTIRKMQRITVVDFLPICLLKFFFAIKFYELSSHSL